VTKQDLQWLDKPMRILDVHSERGIVSVVVIHARSSPDANEDLCCQIPVNASGWPDHAVIKLDPSKEMSDYDGYAVGDQVDVTCPHHAWHRRACTVVKIAQDLRTFQVLVTVLEQAGAGPTTVVCPTDGTVIASQKGQQDRAGVPEDVFQCVSVAECYGGMTHLGCCIAEGSRHMRTTHGIWRGYLDKQPILREYTQEREFFMVLKKGYTGPSDSFCLWYKTRRRHPAPSLLITKFQGSGRWGLARITNQTSGQIRVETWFDFKDFQSLWSAPSMQLFLSRPYSRADRVFQA
jgi:hypothetical protein